ncbi:predicted protein [Chaetoceros tenuissimus]|uniref:Uncharacterized protein n=1 Tax=Chaetoceros tenuissimus TaxID=426638 RepID=A0AAD3GZV6_9STRA|nr:predicted protein [Chaetoceros tenuissimus]
MCSESSSNVSDNENNKSKFLPLQLKKSSPIAISSVKSSEYENKETLAMSQLRYEYQQQTVAMYNRIQRGRSRSVQSFKELYDGRDQGDQDSSGGIDK